MATRDEARALTSVRQKRRDRQAKEREREFFAQREPIYGSPSREGNASNKLRYVEQTCRTISGCSIALPSISLLASMFRKNHSSVVGALGSNIQRDIAKAKEEVRISSAELRDSLTRAGQAEGQAASISKERSVPVDVTADILNIQLPSGYDIAQLIIGANQAIGAPTECPKGPPPGKPIALGPIAKPLVIPVEYDPSLHSESLYDRLATLAFSPDESENRDSVLQMAVWHTYTTTEIGGEGIGNQLLSIEHLTSVAALATEALEATGTIANPKIGGVSIGSTDGQYLFQREGIFSNTSTGIVPSPSYETGKLQTRS